MNTDGLNVEADHIGPHTGGSDRLGGLVEIVDEVACASLIVEPSTYCTTPLDFFLRIHPWLADC